MVTEPRNRRKVGKRAVQPLVFVALTVCVGVGCQSSPAPVEDDPALVEDDKRPTGEQQQSAEEAPGAKLPREDLVLWLHPAGSQLELAGDNVVRWKDASGNQNHLDAVGQSMQPRLEDGSASQQAALRFDGQDDMLMVDGFSPNQLPSATVFVVAAPSASSGNFDALVSAGNRGAEDSFTGFNIDLGGKNFAGCADSYPDPTSALNTINVQSAKTTVDCGQDLLETSVSFERNSLVTTRIDRNETSLRLDGAAQQAAAGGPDTLTVPQLRLGARYHRQKYQGYYDGTISEVIVYGRSLSDEEIAQVEGYLAERHDIALSE